MTIPDGYIREAEVGIVDIEIGPAAARFLADMAEKYGFQVVEIDGDDDPRETQRRLLKRALWAISSMEERYGPGVADSCTLYVSPDLSSVEVETARSVIMLAPDRRENPREVGVETVETWNRKIAVWAERREALSENESH